MILRLSIHAGKKAPQAILFFVIVMITGLLSCKDNTQTPNDSIDHAVKLRGTWSAQEGDRHIVKDIGPAFGFLYYDWYVINPHSGSDSVKITWDNGLTCTTSTGFYVSDSVMVQVYSIQASVRLLNDTSIYMLFHLPDITYWKKLSKQSNDTSYLCM